MAAQAAWSNDWIPGQARELYVFTYSMTGFPPNPVILVTPVITASAVMTGVTGIQRNEANHLWGILLK